ncbi:PREDICTED: BURP domain protein USPL1-like [Nicotiana attenuata]|uniref:Burp domain protein uspl1 n=1 Tax=Nicotiana attenuata TaxID=49451 RepID=A0A1J6JBQ6_NICAT|nr:PREDICTED: BURP domain protein USPL1-like [Nicotiana attenuata]OIT07143.1 burp domain protein uspl1 [Nicotiana attenuata]
MEFRPTLSILLHALLLFQFLSESRARDIAKDCDNMHGILKIQEKEQTSISPMEPLNSQLNIFFTPKDLNIGKKMPLFFAIKDPSTSPQLLSRKEADSIPFSSTNLPYLLDFFLFSKESPQAKAIEDTFFHCEISAMKGESKFCATSLESMLDWAKEILGHNTQLKVYTTDFIKKSPVTLQNYTILQKPKEILAPKIVACHTLPYPYAVFYCHMQKGENKLFKISLLGENGDRIEAAAICHMDTKQWNHDHVAFRVLKVQPGSSPVCHFFPADNLVWVPSSSM